MCTQGGGASTEKIRRLPDAFVPGQYVTNHIDIKEENEPADNAEVPIALSFVRMNVVCGSHENRADVGCAFHATLRVHGCHRQVAVSCQFQIGFKFLTPVWLVPLRTYHLKRLSRDIT